MMMQSNQNDYRFDSALTPIKMEADDEALESK